MPHLSEIFHLDDFETQCLIICLAAEIDCSYEKFYAYLQNDVNKRAPGIGLVLSLFCRTLNEQLSKIPVFDLQSPLLKQNLLQVTDNAPEYTKPLISRSLKLDDRVVSFLLDHEHRKIDTLFEEIARFISPQDKDTVLGKLHVPDDIKARMQNFIESDDAKNLKKTLQKVARADSREGETSSRKFIFYYHGRYGSGKRQLAEAICKGLGLPLIVGDVKKMLAGHVQFEKILALLGRESLLYQAPLCLENFDCLLDDDKYQPHLKMVFEVMQSIFPMTFLLSTNPWNPQELLNGHTFIDIGLKIPLEDARIVLWKNHFEGCPRQKDVDSDLDELAGKFHFTSGQIHVAIIAAQGMTFCRPPEEALIKKEDLYAACRAQSNQKLASLASQVELKHGWDDIILPPDQKEQLREICGQTKNRRKVYDEWGLGSKLTLGRGLNVLFNGPSGTGKTLAAEIITNGLKLDLYKIDLSQVVSKYIGETEKNLNKFSWRLKQVMPYSFLTKRTPFSGNARK